MCPFLIPSGFLLDSIPLRTKIKVTHWGTDAHSAGSKAPALQLWKNTAPRAWGRCGCDFWPPRWSPGLMWLVRTVSPSSLIAPCASLPTLRAKSQRTTFPGGGGLFSSQGCTSSDAPLLEPPNKNTPLSLRLDRPMQRDKIRFSFYLTGEEQSLKIKNEKP